MNDMLQLGPFIIQQSWIILAGALVIGYLVLAYISPFKGEDWKDVREVIGNGILFFVLTFFFGTILLKLGTFLSDPMAVISYPSGMQELYLASIFMTIYFAITSFKRSVSLTKYLHALLYLLLPTTFIYAFIEQKQGVEVGSFLSSFVPWTNHPVSLYTIVFSAALIILLLRMKSGLKSGIKVTIVYFAWVLIQHISNALVVNPQFFGTPVAQTFYFFLYSLGIIIVLINQIRDKKVFLKWKN